MVLREFDVGALVFWKLDILCVRICGKLDVEGGLELRTYIIMLRVIEYS